MYQIQGDGNLPPPRNRQWQESAPTANNQPVYTAPGRDATSLYITQAESLTDHPLLAARRCGAQDTAQERKP